MLSFSLLNLTARSTTPLGSFSYFSNFIVSIYGVAPLRLFGEFIRYLLGDRHLFPKSYPQPLLPQASPPNKGQAPFSKISSPFPKVKGVGRINV